METAVVIMYVEYEYLLCSSGQIRLETSHLSSGRGREFNKHGRSAASISPESETEVNISDGNTEKKINIATLYINSVVSNCLSNRHSLCSSVLLIVNAVFSC